MSLSSLHEGRPNIKLSDRTRIALLLAMLVAGVAAVFFLDPIPQSEAYHGFIDQRSWFGIPNFGDVVSNLPFAFAGAFGLWCVFGSVGRRVFDRSLDRWPYALFFAGVALVSVGSSYYHLEPNSERLVWDRLPMTVAFMSLFAMFIADRIDQRIGVTRLLPILIVAGVASVAYWVWSEAAGGGDLRFYFLVQFYPIVALPIICWLFPKGRYTTNRHLLWLIGWYALAKVLETYDPHVFTILGDEVSGHTLKHLAAAGAVFVVVRMLGQARKPEER